METLIIFVTVETRVTEVTVEPRVDIGDTDYICDSIVRILIGGAMNILC